MMRRPSTGFGDVEIALRTAFSALSVRLIIGSPFIAWTVEQRVGKTYATRQFIDKMALWTLELSPLRRVSGFRQAASCRQRQSKYPIERNRPTTSRRVARLAASAERQTICIRGKVGA